MSDLPAVLVIDDEIRSLRRPAPFSTGHEKPCRKAAGYSARPIERRVGHTWPGDVHET